MHKYAICLSLAVCAALAACTSGVTETSSEQQPLTEYQSSLIEEGWSFPAKIPSGELSGVYGVKPRYGQQDNYFDIRIGDGCDVAIKIMDMADKCIRYCLVPRGSTITVNQIPQGRYYLKLAYGRDWMERENADGTILGMFTKNAVYERSVDIFDFGKKNSRDCINYALDINVVNSTFEHNFTTRAISEAEFLNN